MSDILWRPTAAFARTTRLAAFRELVAAEYGGPPADAPYSELHRWSLDRRGAFWAAVWRFAGVVGEMGNAAADPDAAFVPGPHMTDARWFPGAVLNFAENLLHPAALPDPAFADSPAVMFQSEGGEPATWTRRQLAEKADGFARFLARNGVRVGDRVAAVVPNVPEAVAAMIGTAAVGAVWSSCSPDFGDDAIVDRFGQIEPVVLVTATESTYAGKRTDILAKVSAVLPRLPTVRTVVAAGPDAGGFVPFADASADRDPAGFRFERFPFDIPLAVLYSSGTTGVPKCIVHGAGGTLLQHLKEHQLHTDVRPGDRLFYFTTTGWMMWNWLASALASRATIVLYDGSPLHPDADALWRLAADAGVTQFGASARYFAHLDKAGVRPRERFDLAALRTVLSTGSPLLPETYDAIYRDIKPDVCLASISGGTDIVSCFALGCPTEPVRRGEITAKGLGMDVRVFDSDGRPLPPGEPGELVCGSPFPSMPVRFWNDPGKEKYLGSYFGVFDNVWCHGDWAEETPAGGLVIHGRSDTTLNPGGVRIGTAEIYRQVETFPEVAECLAVPLRRDGDEKIVLFVRLKPGAELTPGLTDAIKRRLRERCSPRHVPAFVWAAPDFPRTVSGKLSEVAVRNALNGRPVGNAGALANPDAVAYFVTLSAARPGV